MTSKFNRDAHTAMNESQDETLEITFPKAALFSAYSMWPLWIIWTAMAFYLRDPLFVLFLIVIVPGSVLAFAAASCFFLRCKITKDGFCPFAPGYYQDTFRWKEITNIKKLWCSPLYIITGGHFLRRFFLPSRYLLKHPESLGKLIDRYSPPGNIARKVLAAA